MTFPAHAVGTAAGPFPATLIEDLAAEIAEHGYDVARKGAELAITLPVGRVEAEAAEAGFAVRIASSDLKQIHQMREAFLHLLDHAAPGLADRMDWRGDLPKGQYPPNFRVATVVGTKSVSPNFLRMTLAAENVEDFVDDGMHFRLAIPPKGRAPVWPHLDAGGRTRWPKGEDALHNPAYTFVDVDPAAGRFAFDLYLHEGGAATGWALGAQAGERVGVAGPGGGTPPPGDFLLIGGDETALPAIRRILELSPKDRRGHVFVELGDPADRCDLKAPSGMTVEWLTRGKGPELWERIVAVPFPEASESRFVWISAERDLARKARLHFRDTMGVKQDEAYISAYWSR
ncbi:siderophore-interacting protein [Jiella mangrovi]|uniref:Siderophore-interacting protein n=1 Tax=Jiella mangrovi TaxID=2821407 RepID=A0ABS4BI31_9HYPH|nr:siderophore-interacting protein [Jiella mangrovi]MBP0616403.1 siderophore-interacting protein [Jiella mangrovi]